MRAKDIMTREVVTVRPQTMVRRAAELLSRHGFTSLPVVDGDGDLIGIVTEADVVRDRIRPDIRSMSRRLPDAEPPPRTVGEVMTTPAVSAAQGADVLDLIETMLARGFRCIPIVDGARLVGVVTRRDLVRCVARPDEQIATNIRHRLACYGGPGRWRVRVDQGRVQIIDERYDPTDAHVVSVIAAAVPGVEHVQVTAGPGDRVLGPDRGVPSDPAR